jgi:hypothetical protein
LLAYSEIAKFGAQIQQLYAITGRERTHVIVFDDLVADPLGVYQRVLEFLHVDYDGQTRFERKCQSRMYRYRWLQRLLYLPVMRHGKVIDTLQRRLSNYNQDNSKRRSLIRRLTTWNMIQKSPAPLSPRMAAIVRETLQADIQLLSSLINRDLSSWFAAKKDYATYRLLPYWKKVISVSTKASYQRCKFSPKLE